MEKTFVLIFLILVISTGNIFSQQDSLTNKIISQNNSDSTIKSFNSQDSLIKLIMEYPNVIDSFNLKIKSIIISGNEITKDYVILREMTLKENDYFKMKELEESVRNIYNLGLFTKVNILPVPISGSEIILEVDVQEKWYIYPLPTAGLEDGEWSKKWIGLNFLWYNSRGRNETLSFYSKVLYDPSISGYYTVPWIGDKLHLSASLGIGYSDVRNKSLFALGRNNGSGIISTNDTDYENKNFFTSLSVAKYITKRLNVFTDFSFNYIRVTQYNSGRTISPSGKDKYMGIGLGANLDTRNFLEYTTKGYYLYSGITRYGYVDNDVNYGQFNLESRSFIPVYVIKDYFLTIASRIYTNLDIGAVLPYYSHVFLGYGDDYVRGWNSKIFEGVDEFTFYNEIRIPLIIPKYSNAKDFPILKNIPYVNKFYLKYGLYMTLIYDIGSTWNNNQKMKNVGFMSGTGIGLNAILPYGYVVRLEWCFPIIKQPVGQVYLSLNARI